MRRWKPRGGVLNFFFGRELLPREGSFLVAGRDCARRGSLRWGNGVVVLVIGSIIIMSLI